MIEILSMSKRHVIDSQKIETALLRLDELVRANSGDDPFDEVFKIVLVKIYTEKNKMSFDVKGEGLTDRFNAILSEIDKDMPNVLTDKQKSSSLDQEHLEVCLSEIEIISFMDANLASLDMFFEYLVSQNSKGTKGQFFTPRYVIEFCTRIISPKKGDMVLDPACGSGGFLFHCLKHNKKNAQNIPYDLWGFDFDSRAVSVAKVLITLCGGDSDNIFKVNSLLRPQSATDEAEAGGEKDITIEDIFRVRTRNFSGFDVIMTNPPFAGEIKQESLINSYDLALPNRKNERDVLFIERCIQLLKPGGRLAIVLPHNKIGSGSYSYVREYILQNMHVVSVLSLPRNTFLPHTHQKADIIFAKKRLKPVKNIPDEKILFMTSEVDSKDSKGNILFKKGVHDTEVSWDSVEHDFEDCIHQFDKFVNEIGLEWN